MAGGSIVTLPVVKLTAKDLRRWGPSHRDLGRLLGILVTLWTLIHPPTLSPFTLNPRTFEPSSPRTLEPSNPQTLTPQPSTLNSQTLNPQPSTLEPSTFNPQIFKSSSTVALAYSPKTFNPKPQILHSNPKPP
jgi:hypothetical protein